VAVAYAALRDDRNEIDPPDGDERAWNFPESVLHNHRHRIISMRRRRIRRSMVFRIPIAQRKAGAMRDEAGLDSFAYRCPDTLRGLQIFEVDHPSSQAWKRARLAELGIETPSTLRYISIDFERETWRKKDFVPIRIG